MRAYGGGGALQRPMLEMALWEDKRSRYSLGLVGRRGSVANDLDADDMHVLNGNFISLIVNKPKVWA